MYSHTFGFVHRLGGSTGIIIDAQSEYPSFPSVDAVIPYHYVCAVYQIKYLYEPVQPERLEFVWSRTVKRWESRVGYELVCPVWLYLHRYNGKQVDQIMKATHTAGGDAKYRKQLR